ncbi:MAG: hypothetical protein COA94_08935, partial [Rickettsiales bacterium]
MSRKQKKEEEEDLTELEIASRSWGGFKGHFTRVVKSAIKSLDFAPHVPGSLLVINNLKEHMESVQKAFTRADSSLSVCALLDDPDVQGDYDGKAEELHARRDNIIAQLMDQIDELIAKAEDRKNTAALEAAAAAPLHGQGAGPGPGPTVRPNAELKPPTLTRDFTPVEFRSWSEKFRAYHSSSRMELGKVRDQQAYLRACLDSYLDSRLARKLEDDTPIFGRDSCIAILQTEWEVRYPILERRLEFWRTKQATGQWFTDWATALHRMGDEAELDNMTINQMYIMRYIVGTNDIKLREKFLAEIDPSLEDLQRIAGAYEVAAVSMKAVAPHQHQAQAHAMQTGQQGGRDKPRGQSGISREDKMAEMRRKDLCFRCAKRKHENKSECPAINGSCNKCQKKGHYSPACLAGYEAKGYRQRVRDDDRQKEKYKKTTSQTKTNQVTATTNAILVGTLTGENAATPRMMVQAKATSGTPFDFPALPDTGATRTIIDADVARTYGIRPKKIKAELVTTASGQSMKCLGSAVMTITFVNRTIHVNALIVEGIRAGFIICWRDLIRLGVLHDTFPQPIPQQAEVMAVDDKKPPSPPPSPSSPDARGAPCGPSTGAIPKKKRRQDSEHDRDGTRQNDNTADTIDSLVAEFADV